MVSSPAEPDDATRDAGTDPAANRRPPTPRWVKVFGVIGIIVLLLVLVIVIGNLVGFGEEHGPGRHATPSGSDGTTTPHGSGSHAPEPTHHTTAAGPAHGSTTGSIDVREPDDWESQGQ